MGIMDKLLDVMSLNPDDDEETFDNEDFNGDDDFFEEEQPKKFFSKKKKEKVNEEPAFIPPEVEKPAKAPKPSKITPIGKSSRKQVSNSMEVCVIKPSSIQDEIEITDTLLKGRTVVINMEGLNVDLAQRIIDFTSGSTYALRGNLQKISNYIFLATPNGVDISGDIQNLMDSLSDFSV